MNAARPIRAAAAFAVAVLCLNAGAQTTTMNTSGNWSEPANWSDGVPSGAIDVTIASGITATVDSVPAYSGTLTLQSDAILAVSGAPSVVSNATTINMNDGSKIYHNNRSVAWEFNAIDVTGSAYYGAQAWPQMHNASTSFNGAISGSGHLEIRGDNNWVGTLTQTSTISGGWHFTANDRFAIRANVTGSLGTGDVVVDRRADGRGCLLVIGAENAMATTATLSLNGNGWNASGGGAYPGTNYPLLLNANQTVSGLFREGVEQTVGTYGRTGRGGVDYEVAWIGGNGILTFIEPIPPCTVIFVR